MCVYLAGHDESSTQIPELSFCTGGNRKRVRKGVITQLYGVHCKAVSGAFSQRVDLV